MTWRWPGTLAAAAAVVIALVAIAVDGRSEPNAAPTSPPRASNEPESTSFGVPPRAQGVALGLFADSPNHDYTPQLEEINALGATHVAVVVTWFQQDVFASEIVADTRRTPALTTIARTLRTAERLGLETMLFPYVRVDQKLEPSHWRGTLQPTDRDAWYRSYEEWIVSLARLAARCGVEIFSIGSEMSTMDVDRDRWVAVIQAVRGAFPAPGRVTYSSNWDHYERIEFWEELDLVGLTGYFELVPPDNTEPTIEELVEGWREWHVRLMRWQAHLGRPLLMTEVGYRSNDGAAAFPWRWGQEENHVDLEEQRQLYEAFARVWSNEPRLGGAFFWNWWGNGGPRCHDYTPRGKPAEGVLRRWFNAGDSLRPDPSAR